MSASAARAIVPGVVVKPPVEAIAKNGNPYLRLSVAEPTGRMWFCAVFQAELIEQARELAVGDTVRFAGAFDATVYEQRISWRLTVLAIEPPRPEKRPPALAPPMQTPTQREPRYWWQEQSDE